MSSVTRFDFTRPLSVAIANHALPECGDGAYVGVRPLGAQDLLQLQKHYGDAPDTSNVDFAFDVLARTLCDDDGQLLFAGADDVRTNFNLSLKTLGDLLKSCLSASGVETREKN